MHSITIWQWVVISISGVCSGLIVRWLVRRRQHPTEKFPIVLSAIGDEGMVGVGLSFYLRLFFTLSFTSGLERIKLNKEDVYLPCGIQVVHTNTQAGSVSTVRFSLLLFHFSIALF